MSEMNAWWNAGEYTFYRLPRAVLDGEKYAPLPAEAKLLYALVLSRVSLSAANGWRDEAGRVFVYFTNAEICARLGCAHAKATRLLRELEGYGLLRRVRQGLGKPDRILLFPPEGLRDPGGGSAKKRRAETPESGAPECRKTAPRKIDYRKKEIRKKESILPMEKKISVKGNGALSEEDPSFGEEDLSSLCSRSALRERVERSIAPCRQNAAADPSLLDELAEVMVDLCADTSAAVRLDGQVLPLARVRERLLRLDAAQISAVMDRVARGDVPRRRPELAAALYRGGT